MHYLDRQAASDGVTKTRRISTLNHCRGGRAWETTSPAWADNRPVTNTDPRGN
ncbi:hypothetical protein ABZ345_34145 [Lentzea sp. NPDC005914]|uniref:hypothetical protein n=1 Tax=Lentzea sp. NPDC005914 TaxID=3154572 RepID=UPI0033E6911E